jgi:hypothetical protein
MHLVMLVFSSTSSGGQLPLGCALRSSSQASLLRTPVNTGTIMDYLGMRNQMLADGLQVVTIVQS